MLYVGIDQHKRHLSFSVRNDQGKIILTQQVSTGWGDVDRFLESLQKRADESGGYVVILEVCGFNYWLVRRLKRWGCRRVYVIAAPPRLRNKTDRRDAAKLSSLLWLNRERVAAGERLIHVAEVYQPTDSEQADRQLVRLRQRLAQELTRLKNAMGAVLRRHNLEQECPTKGAFTLAAIKWMQKLELSAIDRLELDLRLRMYDLYESQIAQVQAGIVERAGHHSRVPLVRTMAKMGEYTALGLLAHIGPIERFPHAKSLANFFGITPGCRNSGNTDRPGGITKAGHPFVRFLLGQMVRNALRSDPGLRQWYKNIKRRRGAKIAWVAVMRRLCEILWHMLTRDEPYRPLKPAGTAESPPSVPKTPTDKPKRAPREPRGKPARKDQAGQIASRRPALVDAR